MSANTSYYSAKPQTDKISTAAAVLLKDQQRQVIESQLKEYMTRVVAVAIATNQLTMTQLNAMGIS